jgi:ubiquinone/menaquinone biosynthesis C-methylase UbiE
MSPREDHELLGKQMQEQWDERARTNSCYYVKSDKKAWSEADYFQSGAEDTRRLLVPHLEARKLEPRKLVALEIGCGNGRMTRELCQIFKHVYALDVSDQMIKQAEGFLKNLANVTLVHGNGVDLHMFQDNMFDYCFSYIVFQHLPTRRVAFAYVEEIFRTLKSGGIARFQFNGYWKTVLERYPKKYLVRLLGAFGIKRKSLLMTGYFDTWVGTYIPKGMMHRRMVEAGFQEVKVEDLGGTDVWAEGRKP